MVLSLGEGELVTLSLEEAVVEAVELSQRVGELEGLSLLLEEELPLSLSLPLREGVAEMEDWRCKRDFPKTPLDNSPTFPLRFE